MISNIASLYISIFTDDTHISITLRLDKDIKFLQTDLENIIQWCESNNMAVPKDKLEYIMCHKFNYQYVLSELPFVVEHDQYSVSKYTTLEPVHQLRD